MKSTAFKMKNTLIGINNGSVIAEERLVAWRFLIIETIYNETWEGKKNEGKQKEHQWAVGQLQAT